MKSSLVHNNNNQQQSKKNFPESQKMQNPRMSNRESNYLEPRISNKISYVNWDLNLIAESESISQEVLSDASPVHKDTNAPELIQLQNEPDMLKAGSPNSAQQQLESDALKVDRSPTTVEKESVTYSKKDFKKIDLSWEHLNIQAITRKKVMENGKKKTVRETKTILNNISGSVKNGRFTAIMGPSGNFLEILFKVKLFFLIQ